MRTLSILLILAGLGAGAVTAYIAAGLATGDRAGDASGFASGPQAGAPLPGTFEPLLVNTAQAGQECCVLCQFGNDSVAMAFATAPTPALERLLEGLEKAAAAAKGPAGACVVVLETSEATKGRLRELSARLALKHVVLGVIDPRGLRHYALHPDAEATVLFYRKQVVEKNRAFRAGEWTETAAGELQELAAKHYAGG
jgi:hypothetical protein